MEEVKRRGRPVRDENDTQSNMCVIKDVNIEPFFIIKDSSNFTVMEKSISTRGFGNKESSNKEQEKVVGYYTSFANALNRIAKEKFYKNQGEYSSIQEYIKTWNSVKNGLDSLLKSIEI
jgi:hypothetical protein